MQHILLQQSSTGLIRLCTKSVARRDNAAALCPWTLSAHTCAAFATFENPISLLPRYNCNPFVVPLNYAKSFIIGNLQEKFSSMFKYMHGRQLNLMVFIHKSLYINHLWAQGEEKD